MKKAITVTDGIINPEIFKNEKIKILWILKEPHDEQSDEDWDMCKFLRERNGEWGLFNYSKWRATFGLICKISWGILESEKTFTDINKLEYEGLTKILDRIAFMNIKKTPGGSVVNYNNFSKYCEDGSAIKNVFAQIDQIRPTIIICGNTFQYLYPHLTDQTDFNYNKDWIYINKDIIWVNGYHPNARINHEKYYNETQTELKKYVRHTLA